MDAGRVSVLKTGPEGKRVQGVDGLTFPPPQDTIELFSKLYPLPCYCSDFPGILAGRPGCGAWHNRTQQEVCPMKQFKFPHIGMRTTKTAVAVMLSYLIFVPFGLLYNESYPGVLAYVGPTYSCIACIVCMQSSLEQTLQVGLSRFVGVFIGAILGVAMLLLEPLLSHWVGIVLMLGAACVCGIWLCMLFNRPAACGMACILPCVMLISGDVSGIQRYCYAAARVSETVVGVTVAFLINSLLPTRNPQPQDK